MTTLTGRTCIRPFTDDDYPAIVELANAVYPGDDNTEASWRRHDSLRPPEHHFARWVAERGGRVVGNGSFQQFEWMYHPNKFGFNVVVHPDFEGQGIGRALYDTVMERILRLDPICVLSGAREDRPRGIRFLQDRGFVEEMRDRESWLDLATFDESRFAGEIEAVGAHDIALKTYSDLADDPERDRKIYDLDNLLCNDMPHTDDLTEIGFERFCEVVYRDTDFIAEACLVAVHGDTYVGLTRLTANAGRPDLYNGTTGVVPDWRGKGIATALKLKNIRWAKSAQYARIRTWNEVNNRAMLGINERLGFVKRPEWINFRKTVREEREEAI